MGNPERLPERIVIVTIDAETGEIHKVESNGSEGQNVLKSRPHDPKVNALVKCLYPAMGYTHEGSHCYTYVYGGNQYTYCW